MSNEALNLTDHEIVLRALELCGPVVRGHQPLPCPPCGAPLLACGALQIPHVVSDDLQPTLIASRGAISRDPGVPAYLLVADVFHPPRALSSART